MLDQPYKVSRIFDTTGWQALNNMLNYYVTCLVDITP